MNIELKQLSNEELIKFMTDEFNKINVDWFIIQEKKEENNKFYPGYIHIKTLSIKSNEALKYINDVITPQLYFNDWETWISLNNELTYEELWEDTFPIWEEKDENGKIISKTKGDL